MAFKSYQVDFHSNIPVVFDFLTNICKLVRLADKLSIDVLGKKLILYPHQCTLFFKKLNDKYELFFVKIHSNSEN